MRYSHSASAFVKSDIPRWDGRRSAEALPPIARQIVTIALRWQDKRNQRDVITLIDHYSSMSHMQAVVVSRQFYRTSPVTQEDLEAQGNVATWRALSNKELLSQETPPDDSYKYLSGYMLTSIKSRMLDAIRTGSSQMGHARHATSNFEHLAITTPEKLDELLVMNDPSSLNVNPVAYTVEQQQRVEKISAALATLPKRECDIFTRYVLDGETLEAIGASMDIGKNRASQILKKTIAQLTQSIDAVAAPKPESSGTRPGRRRRPAKSKQPVPV